MDPADLLARHDGEPIRRENTFELDPETYADALDRGLERGWGVGAFVEHEGRVLLVREDDQWFQPGGVLEPGERPAKGAAREVREETGIDVTVDGLAAVSEQTFVQAETGDSFEFNFATFRATPEHTTVTEDPGLPDEEIHEVAWHETIPENTYERELVVRLLRDSDGD